MNTHHFIAMIEFSEVDDDEERRAWLGEVRAEIIQSIQAGDPIPVDIVYDTIESSSFLGVQFAEDLDEEGRRIWLGRVADRLEGVRRNRSAPLPISLPFKHKR